MSFGKNLAKFRKERKLTQEDLVKLCGVGISQIRRYEADNSTPSLDAIIKIVNALEISIDEMVFDKKSVMESSKITDRELLKQFEMISGLDEEEQTMVKKMLEGVIVRNKIEQMMKPTSSVSWSQRFKEVTDRLAKGADGYSQDDIDNMIDEAVDAVRKEGYANS